VARKIFAPKCFGSYETRSIRSVFSKAMDESKFAEGDTVQLKSGGPIMTIKGIGSYGPGASRDNALCAWFEARTLKEGVFELTTLTKA
jgi:uncharacterized protein YodC (DUF2158 family)